MVDWTFVKVGGLFVFKNTGKQNSKKEYIWLCRCDCGAITERSSGKLRRGVKDSRHMTCATKCRNTTHNASKTKTYKTWDSMKWRCNSDHKNYGGRGVSICKEWAESYEAFLADMGERPEGMTLDRIDPEGDYEPSNCRWADSYTQNTNRRKGSNTGVSGISLVTHTYSNGATWQRFKVKYRNKMIGGYSNMLDAVAALMRAKGEILNSQS